MKTQTEENEEFIYKFGNSLNIENKNGYELKVPVSIPFTANVKELTHRLIKTLKLPCYIEKDLADELQKFVDEKTMEYNDNISDDLVKNHKRVDHEDIVKQWEAAYKGEVVQYCGPIALSDEDLFAEAYHRLVHSPLLDKVLASEQAMSAQVASLVNCRDNELKKLTEKHADEINNSIDSLSEDQINVMMQRHIEAQELLEGQWESSLEALRATQRRDARSWLMSLSQKQQTSENVQIPESPMNPWPEMTNVATMEVSTYQPPELQESFTIHLGSQMKQMHNIRLMACDIMSLCECRGQPQRLHTSLSLYSNELHGLVLFTDTQPTKSSSKFRYVCQQGTEIHFIPVEQQMDSIVEQSKNNISQYRETTSPDQKNKFKGLLPGDCYITKHSSLAEVHIVFHLLTDETLLSGDVNSRHPVILGLRNVLKTASAYDVTCLSIPLFLVHEMSEEMTVSWCSRRAELVFKCIKGFMIETASWGGSELKTLQFVLPKGISEDLFSNLSTMLPSIFRVANPLKFKLGNK